VPQSPADSEHDHLKLEIRNSILYEINRGPDMIPVGRQRFRSTGAFRHLCPAFPETLLQHPSVQNVLQRDLKNEDRVWFLKQNSRVL
jgi:hypothetical protein